MLPQETEARANTFPAANLSTSWILRHELVLFFLITFLFSWSIFFAGASIPFNNPTTYSRMILIGGYGPSLAALLISRLRKSPIRKVPAGRRLTLFLLALMVTIGSEWIDHLWWGHRIDASLLLMDGILITMASVTVSWLLTDRGGLNPGFKANSPWWSRIPWVLVALSVWPVMVLASIVIARLIGWPISAEPSWPNKPLLLILLESFLWYALYGGPLNEEPGWRGFALPRLQARFSPLIASIILGSFWGLWHVPEHFLGIYAGGAFGALIRFMDIPRAVLFTWIYNRTKGSLLIMILFHAAVNTTSLFLPRSHYVIFILCFVAAGIVILAEKMWRKLPSSEQGNESA